jgi:DNA-binding response OmpR family regulator
MPEMNGDELARAIKGLVPSQPVLMITAFADKLCGSENPVDAVLEKPFNVATLRKMVALMLHTDSLAAPVPC